MHLDLPVIYLVPAQFVPELIYFGIFSYADELQPGHVSKVL